MAGCGLGAMPTMPVATVAEENVLCLPDDPVVDALDHALHTGLWEFTYARTNADEYWAETVMSSFDANVEGPPGGEGIHNDVDTRTELAQCDPRIFAVIDGIFADAAPLNLCNGTSG